MAAHTHQSDAEIFSATRKALDECLAVSPSVRVDVDHGTVTLTGGVRWPIERRGGGCRSARRQRPPHHKQHHGRAGRADRVVPMLQHLAIGDNICLTPDPYLGPPGHFMTVADIQPERPVVFNQILPTGSIRTWAFLKRAGSSYGRAAVRATGSSIFPGGSVNGSRRGHFIMQRKQLLQIAKRVESGPCLPTAVTGSCHRHTMHS
jgi:hypothetical protein